MSFGKTIYSKVFTQYNSLMLMHSLNFHCEQQFFLSEQIYTFFNISFKALIIK